VLGEIENAGLVENAAARGVELRERIAAIGSPLVSELRGSGLLIGIGLSEPVAPVIAARALELGLIINAPNDTSIRLAPPLIIGDAEVEQFITLFTKALEATA
jgi:acetylornithine aminotransferase